MGRKPSGRASPDRSRAPDAKPKVTAGAPRVDRATAGPPREATSATTRDADKMHARRDRMAVAPPGRRGMLARLDHVRQRPFGHSFGARRPTPGEGVSLRLRPASEPC